MHMIHRVLSLFLAVALVLGGAGTLAASGCGATAATGAVILSASPSGCGTCCGDEEKGQPRQGCAAIACAARCVSGPAMTADAPLGPGRVSAVEKTAPAPHDELRARAIPPDIPPPR
jgi:hypothetical protein